MAARADGADVGPRESVDRDGPGRMVDDDQGPVVRQLVADYTQAFNARDVEGVLDQFDPEVVFRPTRLSGLRASYRGLGEVREWMDAVIANPVPYRSRVNEIRRLDGDRWLVTGDVVVHGATVSGYIFTLRVANDRMVELTSYLSDEELLQRLGRLP